MFRTLIPIVVILIQFPSSVFSQPVIVVPKSGGGQWVVSYTRMFEKDAQTGTELATFCGTLAQAKLEAARLQGWSQSMDNNSEWRLKKIYIEGEDANAGPPKDTAPKTPTLFDAVEKKMERDKAVQESLRDLGIGKTQIGKFAADLLTKPGEAISKELIQKGLDKAISTAQGEAKKKLEREAADFLAQPLSKLTEVKGMFGDYLKNVGDAYKRAKDAKDELMGLTGSLTEQKLREVNVLVDKFNRETENTQSGLEGVGRIFPKMTPVSQQTRQQVDEWKESMKLQFDLEKRKESLDQRKVELDRQREQLATEWTTLQDEIKPFDPQNSKVISLRKRLGEYSSSVEAYTKTLTSFNTHATSLSTAIARFTGNGAAEGTNALTGSVRLFLGQYSNTADLKGGGTGEVMSSLPEALTQGESHMSANASKQPSYRIEDKDGNVLAAKGLFRNIKTKIRPEAGSLKNAIDGRAEDSLKLDGTTWSNGTQKITFQSSNGLSLVTNYGITYKGTFQMAGNSFNFAVAVPKDRRFTFRGKMEFKGELKFDGEMTDSRPGNVTPGELLEHPIDFNQTYGTTFERR